MSKQELIKILTQKGFLRKNRCLYCGNDIFPNKDNPSDRKLIEIDKRHSVKK